MPHLISSHRSPALLNGMTTSSSSASSFLPRTRRVSWLRSHLLHFSAHFTSSSNNTVTTTCDSTEEACGSGYIPYGSTNTTSERSNPQGLRSKASRFSAVSTANSTPAGDNSLLRHLFYSRTLRLILYIAAFVAYLLFGVIVFQCIEAPVEKELSAAFLQLKAQFIRDYGHCIDGILMSSLHTQYNWMKYKYVKCFFLRFRIP